MKRILKDLWLNAKDRVKRGIHYTVTVVYTTTIAVLTILVVCHLTVF
jgi:hypothetical protein